MDRSRLIKINQHQAREREKKGEGTVKDPTLIDREMDQKFLFELIALIAQTYTPQNTHTHTHIFFDIHFVQFSSSVASFLLHQSTTVSTID